MHAISGVKVDQRYNGLATALNDPDVGVRLTAAAVLLNNNDVGDWR